MKSIFIQGFVLIMFAAVSYSRIPVKKDCRDAMGGGRCLKYMRYYKKLGISLCSTPFKARCQITCRICSPPPACEDSDFGCCWDKKTRARGPGGEGCPFCRDQNRGKCKEIITSFAKHGVSKKQVCSYSWPRKHCPQSCDLCGAASPAITLKRCLSSTYGCCWDFRPALGPNGEGCAECIDTFPHSCRQFDFYCGEDGVNYSFMRRSCPLRCGLCSPGKLLLQPYQIKELKL
ncbi:papilin [Nematostella vectensis]|uniref:papilin n=1 Tax=Nematostella vectensis TaxID=45351 RepID=UPI0020771D17|nr:papilin [Nematostella vectensis]